MSRRVARPRNALRLPRFVVVFVAALVVAIGTVTPIEAATASASVSSSSLTRSATDATQSGIVKTSLSGFNAGNIISDAVFTSKNTMSEAQIQSFLNSKVSKCVVGKDEDGLPFVCLKDLKVPTQSKPADAYCKAYSGASSESAARILYKVAQACSINPQVLIVMLQKEQGLVNHVWPSNWRYNKAMGQACPDTAPCDTAFAGFFAQVYGAARQMQIYMEGKYFQWYKAGRTWDVLYHPNASCGTAPVYIANKATEALYYYTPYQPNAAALRAGYGTGDGCSSYGNRNFYNYFTDWFGPTGASVDECAPPNGGTRSAKLAYVVTAGTTPSRIAPRSGCDDDAGTLSQGDIVQAVQISGSGIWLEVYTEDGRRWILRDHVRKATSTESACTIAGGVGPAKMSYVITSGTAARIAPRSGCGLDAQKLSPGTIVTASKVSGSGLWLKVGTTYGDRWILRADTRSASSSETQCAYPTDARSAKYAYVLTAAATMRGVPDADCGPTSGKLAVGSAVRAVEAVDGWLKVATDDGEWWIDRSKTRRATSAEAVCIVPAGSTPAKLTYVTTISVTARTAPDTGCATGAQSLAKGSVVTAVQLSADGAWLKVGVGSTDKWIPRGDTRRATTIEAQCAEPLDAGTAKLTYIVVTTTNGRTAPTTECSAGATSIAAGTVFTANRVTADGDWLRTTLDGKNVWVWRDNVRKATTAERACVLPSSRTAYKSYVVTAGGVVGRTAPNTGCTGDAVAVSRGVVVTASAVTSDGDWLKVGLPGGQQRWIPRDSARYATAAEVTCPAPSGATAAKMWYQATTDATTRAVPDAGCTSGTGTLRKGTVAEATQLSADGAWLKLRIGSTQKWVLRADLQQLPSLVTTASVNLRESASTSSAVITTLAEGTRVAALAQDGDWWRVKTRAGVGWVNAPYVR